MDSTTFKAGARCARAGKPLSTRRSVLPVLAALVLAGCLNAPSPPPPAPEPPMVVTGSWRLDCALSNWNETCNARASFNDAPSKTEIDLVVNPTDPQNVFVAAKDLDPMASDCVWSVGYWTKDGGRTWNTTYVGGTLEERSNPTHPLYGYNCVTDPIMAFDSQGVLYYPLQAYDLSDAIPTGLPLPGGLPLPVGTGSAFLLAVSRDGGQTFPAEDIEVMAIAEGGLVFHDYPRMAVSPSTDSVSTVWNAVGAAGINPYVVTVRGGMIGAPVIVELPNEVRSTQFSSGYAATSDGTYYMTVSGSSATTPGVWLAISTDDAQRFESFKPMFDVAEIPSPLPNAEFRTFTAIELAAAPDGRLYAAWADYARNNSDILVAWTDDQGDTWSPPRLVTNSTNDQFMVRATVSADGTLHLLYMDRQHDPENRLIDFTHSYSEDGGVTWFHQRLTTTSFDGDLGIHQAGFPFIGDYNGIGTVGDHTWFAFPTTHTGRAEVAVAHAMRTNSTAPPP